MSITHSLKLESNRLSGEILNMLLLSSIGLQSAVYDEMKAEGDGLYGRVADISKVSQRHFLEEYGSRANIAVIFDEDSDGDIEAGEKAMGKAVVLLLSQETGDAMFFHVVDTPIMKRINGRISVVKEEWSKWLTDALSNAGFEYEVKTVEGIWSPQSQATLAY